jgi:hypothetical protein
VLRSVNTVTKKVVSLCRFRAPLVTETQIQGIFILTDMHLREVLLYSYPAFCQLAAKTWCRLFTTAQLLGFVLRERLS